MPENLKYGLYLCEVKGLKHLNYAILKYTKDGWWQYAREYVADIDGWIGLGKDLQIVRIVSFIGEK